MYRKKIGWKFDNTYLNLSQSMFSKINPTPVKTPKVILFNHGSKEFVVNNEDRIAQMVLVPIIKAKFEEVESLPETIRGKGGFGSTGK